MTEDKIELKILLLGDMAVGKTTLMINYVEDYYQETYFSTIGLDYKEKKLEIKGINITLQIWDTAGEERFRTISKSFTKEADGVLFVFDITSRESFTHIKQWIKDTEDNRTKDFKKIILANKCDIEDKREVLKDEYEKFGQDKDIPCYETSAKNGLNVEVAFRRLAELIVGDSDSQEIIKRFKHRKTTILKKGANNVNDNNDNIKNSSCCS